MKILKYKSAIISILVLLILNIAAIALAKEDEEDYTPLRPKTEAFDIERYRGYVPIEPECITPIPNANSDPIINCSSSEVVGTDTDIEQY